MLNNKVSKRFKRKYKEILRRRQTFLEHDVRHQKKKFKMDLNTLKYISLSKAALRE